MRFIPFIFCLLLLSANVCGYPIIPDHTQSPGQYCTVNDNDFQTFRYPERIAYCERNVSSRTKDRVCERDGVYDRRIHYTVDHIVPLSLGGSNRVDNLWCQHRNLYTAPMESYYYALVRDGKIRRLDAVHLILRCKFYRICDAWQSDHVHASE